jgi:hypothetical protein
MRCLIHPRSTLIPTAVAPMDQAYVNVALFITSLPLAGRVAGRLDDAKAAHTTRGSTTETVTLLLGADR